MNYTPYTNLAIEGVQALKDYLIDRPEAAPSDIRDLMRTQTPDLVTFGDLLQAIYDAPRGAGSDTTVGPILMQIAASCLMLFDRDNFLVIGKNDDSGASPASRMSLALRRDSGEVANELMPWPDPSTDPGAPDPEDTPES